MPDSSIKTILLVEDEILIAMMEMKQLEKALYRVVIASSGEGAIKRIKEENEPFDLILMDIDLGDGMDGTETAREILKWHNIPVVFLSSHTEKDIVEKTEAITNYGYVVKNSSITVLDASIKMAFKLFLAHQSIDNQRMDIEAAYEEMQAANEELLNTQQELLSREKQLIESETTFRALFEKGPIGVAYHRMVYDEAGRPIDYFFLKANGSYQGLTGVNPVGKLATEAFPGIENDPNDWIGKFGEVARTGTEVRYQQHLDINDRWYDCVAYQYKAGYFVTAFNEITERKKAEEEVNRVNGLLRAIIDNAPLGAHFYELMPDGRLVFTGANKMADKILNVKNTQFIGKTIEDAFPNLVATDVPVTYRKVALDGVPFNEEQVEYADDKGISGAFEIAAFQTKVNNMAVLFRDITEKKKIEEALLASERRYRELIRNSTDSVTVLDKDGMQIYVSDVVEKMLGFTPAELINIPVIDNMIHPDDREGVLTSFQKIIHDGQGGAQYRHRHKNGSWVYLEAWGTNQLDNPDIRGVIVNVRDVTERKIEEAYRSLSSEVLAVLNKSSDINDSVRYILTSVRKITGADAIGIRLQDGEDFPFFMQDGFSDDFLLTENSLLGRDSSSGICRDLDGTASLECTCGLVISGMTDPSNPLYTRGGSAWTNDSSSLLKIPPEEERRHKARNICVHHKYSSLALVPIRVKDRIIGLMQINGYKKGLFTQYAIHMLEEIASHIGETLVRKNAEDHIADLLDEKEIILKEVHHRVKNNMSTISSILDIQAGSSSNPELCEKLEEASGRVRSMMAVYDKLYMSQNFSELNSSEFLLPLVTDILSIFPSDPPVAANLDVGDFMLNVKILSPISIILNELITNTMKYAFKGISNPLITVTASKKDRTVTLLYADNGVGLPDSVNIENSDGFGMQLIGMLVKQIKGKLRVERNAGTLFEIEFQG